LALTCRPDGCAPALDLHAELVAHAFGGLEHRRDPVADHLHQAFAVAQVDEDHAAVVAAALHPAAQRHGLAHQVFGHETQYWYAWT
jgi:hypothetical protein